MAGPSLRFDAAEKRLVRARAGETAAAEVIPATVNNRIDNELRGASVADHCPPPRFATDVRASWLPTRFLAVVRMIPSDDGIVSTLAGNPIFHADEPGARPRLAR